jgi:hypothetical protein
MEIETEDLKLALADIAAGFTIIETYLEGFKSQTSAEVAAAYVAIKTLNDTYNETGKIISKVVDEIKHVILPECFEREGLSSFTTKSGYRVTVSSTVRATIADKVGGYEWLRENGLGDIITETVNASTMGAVAKGMLEEGKELPDQFFKTYIQSSTSITKTK